jgi:hypothetical protein
MRGWEWMPNAYDLILLNSIVIEPLRHNNYFLMFWILMLFIKEVDRSVKHNL